MGRLTLVACALGACSAIVSARALGQVAAAADSPIRCEFRAFDGTDEVSRETAFRVYPAGQRDTAAQPTGQPAALMLAPGFYDLQAIRAREGVVVSIRHRDHVLVTRYPDEPGPTIQVINFKTGFGALHVQAGRPEAIDQVAVFAAGDRQREIGKAVRCGDSCVVAVPAGAYDVQVRQGDGSGTPTDQWLTRIEVASDRTVVKRVSPHP